MSPHLGGLEVAAESICRLYVEAGCQVRWVASRVSPPTTWQYGERILVPCFNGFEQWLGVPWPVWGPGGVREVARLAQWADILHIHDCLYFGSAVAVWCARRARKPLLLSQHIGFVRYRSPLLNGLERLAYGTLGRLVLRGASHVAFCTPAAEEFVTGLLGRRAVSATTIPYGVDTERFVPPTPLEREEARRSFGLPQQRRIVLFAGRLVEKKGVDIFLEVSRKRPLEHFLIVGDGPLRPGKADNVTWIPFIPPEHMEKVYQAADVLLLPSHGEGFPLSILEAMATGLPVITSAGQTFASLLEREKVCLAVERTSAAFHEALDRLWKAPEVAAAMAARSRQLVVQQWGLKVMGSRYLALLHVLTGKS